jgi:signal transduction histidine kinase/ActR/RegA family two-component response regulator
MAKFPRAGSKENLVGGLKRIVKLEKIPGQGMLLFPAALVLAAGVAAVVMFFRMSETSSWVSHTLEVRLAVGSVLDQMQDAEAGERGYVLTGKDAFLDSYRRASARIEPAVTRLRNLTGDNAAQLAVLDRLEPLIEAKLKLVAEQITFVGQGEKDQAAALTMPGKEIMDKIRAQIAEVTRNEKDLQVVRDQADWRARNILLFLILCGLAGAAALTAIAVRSQGRLVRNLQDEATKRETAEASLRQAQKMEAVGQLTGGVAHDFNNLLTIILGNLDTIRRRLANVSADAATPLARPVDAAIQGAKNAAKLTHRLLAFSRMQPLDPIPLDLNKSVAGVSDLLMRTAGSPITIEIVQAAGLWLTMADANQLENVLVNLAVNAKDAMPEGGKITIETANGYLDETYAASFGDVPAGQYVVLSVTDTGSGIPAEVLDRVFEPFFTTKQPGFGTGLGLSMVHGFVKQSGGHVRIYSEVGYGTSVKIYLPRLPEEAAIAAVPKARDPESKPLDGARGCESVLIVEDNEGVLEFACGALEDLGYRVLTAKDGPEALAHLESDEKIDLLFTDVVMTKDMTGRQLAGLAHSLHPGLPVLFTTGYSRNAIAHQGRLDASVNLLSKPYTQGELARKVRAVLDEASRERARSNGVYAARDTA